MDDEFLTSIEESVETSNSWSSPPSQQIRNINSAYPVASLDGASPASRLLEQLDADDRSGTVTFLPILFKNEVKTVLSSAILRGHGQTSQ
jgi:hypothetical protein